MTACAAGTLPLLAPPELANIAILAASPAAYTKVWLFAWVAPGREIKDCFGRIMTPPDSGGRLVNFGGQRECTLLLS